MNIEKSKLLDKIQKLLALSTSPNPAEAASALAKVQQLMTEHNLAMGDVHANQVGSIKVKSTQSVSKPKDWEVRLMQLVGNAFGCKIIWCPGYSHDADYWGRFEFVGPKGQLELVEYAATYLQRKLVKARADFAQELPKHFTRKEKTRQLDGFAKGWLNAISVKLIAFTNPKDVEDAIEERLKNLNTAKIDDRGHGQHGHLHGMADGLNVEIHRPMNKGEDAKQLGGA